MIILERDKITYYVKDESVVVGIGSFQWITYSVYSLQNRKPFYDFRRELLKSPEGSYATAAEALMLGERFGLKGSTGRRPQIAVDSK